MNADANLHSCVTLKLAFNRPFDEEHRCCWCYEISGAVECVPAQIRRRRISRCRVSCRTRAAIGKRASRSC